MFWEKSLKNPTMTITIISSIITSTQIPPPPSPPHYSIHHSLSTNLLSLALTVTLTATPFASQAIPSLNSATPPPLLPTTPFAQSKKLLTGLENGYGLNCLINRFWLNLYFMDKVCSFFVDFVLWFCIAGKLGFVHL